MTLAAVFAAVLAAVYAFIWYALHQAQKNNLIDLSEPPMPSTTPANMPPATAAAPSTSPTSKAQQVYETAVSALGKHLTLNDAVNPETGCAEAVSWILRNCDYTLPPGGIPTVLGLIAWMKEQGFEETDVATPGCIITASGNPEHAHIGIIMKYGVASNDSRPQFLGKFLENYRSVATWSAAFAVDKSVTSIFIPC